MSNCDVTAGSLAGSNAGRGAEARFGATTAGAPVGGESQSEAKERHSNVQRHNNQATLHHANCGTVNSAENDFSA